MKKQSKARYLKIDLYTGETEFVKNAEDEELDNTDFWEKVKGDLVVYKSDEQLIVDLEPTA
jgi:hypothetical protein